MKAHLFVTIGCALLVFAPVKEGHADPFSRKIPVGASFGDVLGIWGEPVDKVEKGILHKVVWYYPDGAKVVFKDGRVQSFLPTKAVLAVQKQQANTAKVATSPVAVELSGEARDLVRDIAREVPSGPDISGGPSGASAAPPPLIPNQAPPGGRVAPGEAVLGEVDELDED